jgi:hypothetical protein
VSDCYKRLGELKVGLDVGCKHASSILQAKLGEILCLGDSFLEVLCEKFC